MEECWQRHMMVLRFKCDRQRHSQYLTSERYPNVQRPSQYTNRLAKRSQYQRGVYLVVNVYRFARTFPPLFVQRACASLRSYSVTDEYVLRTTWWLFQEQISDSDAGLWPSFVMWPINLHLRGTEQSWCLNDAHKFPIKRFQQTQLKHYTCLG